MGKILVTGATGFIGKPLVERLLREEHEVYILSRNPAEVKGAKTIVGDITKKETLKLPKDIEIVFHLAALTNSDKPEKEARDLFESINYQGTINLAESCRNAKKFIFFSGVDALGIIQDKVLDELSESKANSPYDLSKYKAERYLLEKYKKEGFPSVILRPALVYGEGELSEWMKVNVAFFKIMKMVKKHFFITAGNGKNLLPLVHVKDIVEGSILASKKGKPGEIYILADNKSYSLNEVVATIADIEKIRFSGFHVPKSFMKLGAFLFEVMEKFIGINAPIRKSGIDYITQNRMFNISKARKELGYNPGGLNEGMKQTINWFKSEGLL